MSEAPDFAVDLAEPTIGKPLTLATVNGHAYCASPALDRFDTAYRPSSRELRAAIGDLKVNELSVRTTDDWFLEDGLIKYRISTSRGGSGGGLIQDGKLVGSHVVGTGDKIDSSTLNGAVSFANPRVRRFLLHNLVPLVKDKTLGGYFTLEELAQDGPELNGSLPGKLTDASPPASEPSKSSPLAAQSATSDPSSAPGPSESLPLAAQTANPSSPALGLSTSPPNTPRPKRRRLD